MGFFETSFSDGSFTDRKRFEAVGTETGRLTIVSVDVWEVCVVLDFLASRDDLASSYCKDNVNEHVSHYRRSQKLTNVTKAVFPDPLGPSSKKLLTGGDATVR